MPEEGPKTMTTLKTNEHGFWLKSKNGAPLSASIHLPQDPIAGALVCNAFAEERKGCLKPLVDLSRRLAARGIAVLRFDYSGCGDSPGTFGGGGLDCWRDDIAVAAEALASFVPGGAPLFWIGARCGAMLMLDCASRVNPGYSPSAFLLWDPIDGASFVKQLLQRNRVNTMIAYGRAKYSTAEIEAVWQSGGSVDLDGYLFPSKLVSDLRNFGPVPIPKSGPVPIFPSHESGPVPPKKLSGLVLKLGTDPKSADALIGACPHFEEQSLRLPPFWNTIGQVDVSNLLDISEKWVMEQIPESGPVPVSETGTGPVFCQQETGTGPKFWGLEQVEIEGPKGVVRGILQMPAGAVSGAVLFLHGWSGDRSGPHGLFTAAATRLAGQGNACLRIDFGGRGASDGLASEASIARMADEAGRALEFLRKRTGLDHATVIALCSGCKVAITLASREPSVDRLVLWSAESMGSLRDSATGWRKRRAALLAYAKKLCRPETWKKILKRQVKVDMVGKALTSHETRSADEARVEDATLSRFRDFRGRILFVYGGSDPDAPGSSKAYEAFCRRNRIRADHRMIPNAGHSYYAADWTEELLSTTLGWL